MIVSTLILAFVGTCFCLTILLNNNNTKYQKLLKANENIQNEKDKLQMEKDKSKTLAAQASSTPVSTSGSNSVPRTTSTTGNEKSKICSTLSSNYLSYYLPQPDSSKVLFAIGTSEYETVVAEYNAQAKTYNQTQEAVYQQYLANFSASSCTNPWPKKSITLTLY
jgi:hypothetical protein